MTCKERVEAYLREQRVPFESQHHRVTFTAQEVAASEHLPGDVVAKVVMIFADADMVMLVLPASHRANLSKVAAELGVINVWLADEHEFSEIFRDCEIGAMPPFGNLYGVPVYVDRTLAEDEVIVFRAVKDRELEILALHGFLHVLGHDHETDHGEMDRLERRLRRRLLA